MDNCVGNRMTMRRAIKKEYRETCLCRMGLPPLDTQKDIRICNKHQSTNEEVLVKWTTMEGEIKTTKQTVYVPSGVSLDQAKTTSKGSAVSRNINRQIQSTQEMVDEGDEEAAYRLMMLYSYNVDDPPSSALNNNQTRLGVERTMIEEMKKQAVVVRFKDLNNNKVKLQTGFPSLLVIMGFITVVSHGEVKEMMARTTKLTWFEEWYMYFEVLVVFCLWLILCTFPKVYTQCYVVFDISSSSFES
jgi:hypothetical protein